MHNRLKLALCSTMLVLTAAALPAAAGTTDDTSRPLVLSVVPANGALVLEWTDVAEAAAYTVIDDRTGNVLSSGAASAATVAAAPGTSHDLALFAEAGGRATHVADVLTAVPATGVISGITAVTTQNGTTLSWLPVDGVARYVVFEGDREILSTSLTSVALPARIGDSVRYSVAGDLPSGDDFVLAVDLAPSTTDLGSEGEVAAASTKTIGTSLSRYETFIPMEYVDSYQIRNTGDYFEPVSYACEGSTDKQDYWYGGDNRDQSPGTATWNSGKFRTQGNAYTYWGSKSYRSSQAVAPTKRYVKSGTTYTLKDSRVADNTGFSVRALSNDGRTSRWIFEHEVANPYCDKPTGGITYTSQQDLYSNGGHYIYGAHDKAPNHSVHRADYYTDGTSFVQLVFVHQVEDFKCLSWAAGCGARNYQYVR
jgi:hypothetical protein